MPNKLRFHPSCAGTSSSHVSMCLVKMGEERTWSKDCRYAFESPSLPSNESMTNLIAA